MGTRQELGLALLCLILAGMALWHQRSIPVVSVPDLRCPIPSTVGAGRKIRLRCDGGKGGHALAAQERLLLGLKLDVNRAGAKELQLIPGIGPVKARRIIEERSKQVFAGLDDLLRVHGIGPKTLARIRVYLRVHRSR
ncbi:MAG: helix-hairpin-helix domain-containing protein [Deltaproteobacteria bacterium]|nr:helix-hairpin-helix domain-containing protein [Deltaproteobacteria bacterium]